MLTITNNSGDGQPLPMENARAVRHVRQDDGIPLYFDGCRFAENAYFIKMRERGFENETPIDIARLMFGEHAQMDLVRLAIPRRSTPRATTTT